MKVSAFGCLCAAMVILASGSVITSAQSVPCAAITRNPQVLEALLDSHSKDADTDSDSRDDAINAVELQHLHFAPTPRLVCTTLERDITGLPWAASYSLIHSFFRSKNSLIRSNGICMRLSGITRCDSPTQPARPYNSATMKQTARNNWAR